MTARRAFDDSGFDRLDGDAYFTEPWVALALYRKVALRGPIWEPAAGAGAIAATLRAQGHEVFASDIAPAAPGIRRFDFLCDRGCDRGARLPAFARRAAVIATNPPYQKPLPMYFIERALRLTAPDGQVAMLLRHDYDTGGGPRRVALFDGCPAFAGKLTLTARPYWVPERRATPRFSFAWFLWDHRHRGPPTLTWGR